MEIQTKKDLLSRGMEGVTSQQAAAYDPHRIDCSEIAVGNAFERSTSAFRFQLTRRQEKGGASFEIASEHQHLQNGAIIYGQLVSAE